MSEQDHGQEAEHGHDDHGDHGHGHHGDHSQHYIRIWGILLALLAVSVIGPEVGAATGIQIITLITAFGIAFVKAYLVMKHFMHLDVERPVVWYILTTSLVFMLLFFAGVSPDVMNHSGSRWENVAAKNVVATRMAAGPGDGHHGDDHGGDHGDGHGGDHGDDHGEGHNDGH